MLSSVQCCPCDSAGILSLEEEGLGFAILEAEDLAVATDVEFALELDITINLDSPLTEHFAKRMARSRSSCSDGSRKRLSA